MTMQDTFGIGAFRSRQQVMRFDSALRRAGVRTELVSTPKDVSIGCGLSVRFDLQDLNRVLHTYQQFRPGNLIGFYQVRQNGAGRPDITPLAGEKFRF